MNLEQAMLTRACMDRSGDTEADEQMKDLLLRGANEIKELREALEPFAKAADGRRSKGIKGCHCFGQAHLIKARDALSRTSGKDQ